MNFIISKMDKENTEAVAEIEKSCFSKPWSLSAIEAELENPNAHFYVLAVEDNNTGVSKIVGYGGMHIILDEAYIANIAVFPDFRKNGFGKAITTQLINNALKHSCEFISLEVRPSNTNAVKMYSLLGFEEIGRRRNFYSAPVEDGLIMTKYLNTKD
ncbi:MAG: ribosomal protein S18-alanine N-acetyltransferase [Acutalibacteraceae bacterium]|nr:ribosomal protein S18-alanine N-acetyltransferase [Acutalibacteraceae bacterium]